MTTAYCTYDQLAPLIGKQVIDDVAVINGLILAVSESVDRICNRPDGFVASADATTRLFAGSGSGWLTGLDEFVELEGVAVKVSSADAVYSDWELDSVIPFRGDPTNPDFNHTPYDGIMSASGSGHIFTSPWQTDALSWGYGWDNRGLSTVRSGRNRARPPTVQITARWGYATAIPGTVQQAALMMTARLWKRGKSAYADTVASPETGLSYRVQLDPDVKLMLERGRMIRVAI